MSYQPKTGARCACRPGIERDNCVACEGTGMQIDFARIRAASRTAEITRKVQSATDGEVRATFATFTELDQRAAELETRTSRSRYTSDIAPRAGLTRADIHEVLSACAQELARRGLK